VGFVCRRYPRSQAALRAKSAERVLLLLVLLVLLLL
jgi:hypothetical protein